MLGIQDFSEGRAALAFEVVARSSESALLPSSLSFLLFLLFLTFLAFKGMVDGDRAQVSEFRVRVLARMRFSKRTFLVFFSLFDPFLVFFFPESEEESELEESGASATL